MLSGAVAVNEYFPLQFRDHLIFGIIGIVFFLFQYYRLRKTYQVLMALGIGATFLLYLGQSVHNIVGLIELVIMTLVVISLVRDSMEEKKKKKAQTAENHEVAEEPENSEIPQEDQKEEATGGENDKKSDLE